jgi:KUP system potassium uptake protein
MVSWHFGFEVMRHRHTVLSETPDEFFRCLRQSGVPRVPGAAIFLTRLATTTPFLIVEHVAQMRALHETAIALTVKFEDIPRVAPRDRIALVNPAEGFWHIIVHFGFVQVPDIPAALRQAKDRGCPSTSKTRSISAPGTPWSAPNGGAGWCAPRCACSR